MPVRFVCEHCNARLTVSRRFAGQPGQCPGCQRTVMVPEIEVAIPAGDAGNLADASAENRPAAARGQGGGRSSGAISIAELRAETAALGAPALQQDSRSGASGEAKIPSGEQKRSWWMPARERASFSETIPIKRWVVYVQGALLGVAATTFFIFGMMVGRGTAPIRGTTDTPASAVVSGTVLYRNGSIEEADSGSVVIFLPVGNQPDPRPEPDTLVPERFQPLNNPAIDTIRSLGGNIVRVDRAGRFETRLQGGQYWLMVLSRNRKSRDREIEKSVRADIGDYFLPIEDLLGNRAFHWEKIRVSGPAHDLPSIVF